MVESARPLMTPRADLANGVAGVVVVGALLSMESGTVPIGGGVGSQLAKVVAVGVQRSSLYILYTLPPNTEPRLEPEQANGTRASAIARHGERAAGLGRVHSLVIEKKIPRMALCASHPHDRSKGVHTTSLV